MDRKYLWLLPAASQALSSIANFSIPILGMRSLSPTAFGELSLAYLTVQVTSQIIRSTIGEAGLLASKTNPLHGPISDSILSLGLFASSISALSVGAGVAYISDSQVLGTAVGITCLGVTLAELVKSALLVEFQIRRSASLDLLWALLQFSLMLVLLSTHHVTPSSLLLSWGVAGLVSAIPIVAYRLVHHRTGYFSPDLLRSGVYLGLDTAILYLAPFSLVALLAANGGTAQVGLYQAALLPFRPLQLLLSSASVALLAAKNRRHLLKIDLLRTTGLIIVGTVAIVLTTWLLPFHIGVALLGPMWKDATELWYVGALNTSSWVLSQNALLLLKIDNRAQELLIAKLIAATSFISLGLAAQVSTPQGVAMVSAAGSTAATFTAFILWQRPLRSKKNP